MSNFIGQRILLYTTNESDERKELVIKKGPRLWTLLLIFNKEDKSYLELPT